MPLTVFTIGHSNRGLEAFLALLVEHGVELLTDVRRFPGSRRFPHFRRETLSVSLEAVGIGYRHSPGLGGHRKVRVDSPHTALTNTGLRAYADHMETPEFVRTFRELLELAREQRTVMMCAEGAPSHCHRQFVADALVVGGHRVVHILGPGLIEDHTLHPSARSQSGRLIYDSGAGRQTSLFD